MQNKDGAQEKSPPATSTSSGAGDSGESKSGTRLPRASETSRQTPVQARDSRIKRQPAAPPRWHSPGAARPRPLAAQRGLARLRTTAGVARSLGVRARERPTPGGASSPRSQAGRKKNYRLWHVLVPIGSEPATGGSPPPRTYSSPAAAHPVACRGAVVLPAKLLPDLTAGSESIFTAARALSSTRATTSCPLSISKISKMPPRLGGPGLDFCAPARPNFPCRLAGNIKLLNQKLRPGLRPRSTSIRGTDAHRKKLLEQCTRRRVRLLVHAKIGCAQTASG